MTRRRRYAEFLLAVVGVCVLLSALFFPRDAPVACGILFVGDTSFGENYQLVNRRQGEPNILDEKGYDYPLALVKPLVARSDLVIANLETPITDLPASPFTGKKDYVHWTDVTLAPKHLAKHNIRVVSLANNHTLDYGAPGLRQTLDVLAENRMAAFGAGRNETDAARPFLAELAVGDRVFTLAVFGAFEYSARYDRDYRFYARGDEPGTNALALETLSREIVGLKESDPRRYVVVFPHWGGNYAWKSPEQTRLAHALIDVGADLVVGHGAHMMQEIEPYRGRWILYGLGNFMFNSPGRYESKNVDPLSLAARLLVRPGERGLSAVVRIYPIFCDNLVTNYQSRPVTEDEFDRAAAILLAKCPDPAEFRRAVRRDRDEIGHFLEFSTPLP